MASKGIYVFRNQNLCRKSKKNASQGQSVFENLSAYAAATEHNENKHHSIQLQFLRRQVNSSTRHFVDRRPVVSMRRNELVGLDDDG